jgi:hypothetical protein
MTDMELHLEVARVATKMQLELSLKSHVNTYRKTS